MNNVSASDSGNVSLTALDNLTYSKLIEEAVLRNATIAGSGWQNPLNDIPQLLPFLNIFMLLYLGFLVKKKSWITKQSGETLRNVVFKYMMTVFMFRTIWRVKFDTSLYVVTCFGAAFYMGMGVLSAVLCRLIEWRKREQGWLAVIMQGRMMGLLYPLLADAPHFGDQALACALMWDLGGNMWMCSGLLFGIAEYQESLALRRKEHLNHEPCKLEEGREKSEQKNDTSPTNAETEAIRSQSSMSRALAAVVAQPMFHAAVLGILLNNMAVTLPPSLDVAMYVFGAPLKPGMYFILGFYAEFDLEPRDRARLLLALTARTLVTAVFAVGAMFLPLKLVFRQTIAIALLSPMTSQSVQVVAEIGWGDRLLRLTVACLLASVLVSSVVQHSLVGFLTDVGQVMV